MVHFPRGKPRVFGRASLKSGHFLRAFHAAMEAAELSRLRWHDLRHLFAVNWVRSGVSLPDLARLTGHRTLAMVWRHCSHSPVESSARAFGLVDGVLTSARA